MSSKASSSRYYLLRTAPLPGQFATSLDRDGRHSDQSATVYKSRHASSESLTTRSCPAWNCWDWKKRKRELQCLPLPECPPNPPSNHLRSPAATARHLPSLSCAMA